MIKRKKSEFIIILVTAKDETEAQKISKGLLAEKLVACATLVPAAQSFFWWDGKIDSSAETLMILKTQKKFFARIVMAVKTLHSYSVPEVIALPIRHGSPDYLDWIVQSTRKR